MLATDKSAPSDLADQLVSEYFSIQGNDLVIGGRTVRSLVEDYGSPLYIYDAAIMRRCFAQLKAALTGFADICFSIKANPNPAVAAIFVQQGAGIEIASAGEYERARRAGADTCNILFAGPGKRDDELEHVIRSGIGEIHLECFEEIDRVDTIAARHGKTVAVAIRVNPVAAAQGGAMRMGGKPSPFGFDEEQIGGVLNALAGKLHLDLVGLHLFAGTQILDTATLLTQWQHGLALSAQIAQEIGRPLSSIDLGGGLGIPYYAGDRTLDLDAIRQGLPSLIAMKSADPLLRDARVIVEPGRYLAGPGGLYVARVVASKLSRGSRFIVTDGGMHHHLAASGNLGQVMKRDYPIVAPARMTEPHTETCSIVGPLCTPLDTLARKVTMPKLEAGDLIAILQSGAYGLSASPVNFLGHPAPAEVLVDDGRVSVIRRRESFSPAD